MDPTALIAMAAGILVILGGNWMEGGHVSSLIQPAAAFIVVGGTCASTWLASPKGDLMALKSSLSLLVRGKGRGGAERVGQQLQEIATVVRRDGLLAAEGLLANIEEPILQRGLRMLVDGASMDAIVPLLETESEHFGEIPTHGADVMDAAGGYAPTIGILGAVLGLIHVMNNIAEPEKLGSGIAVAFVATIYGVGLANLVLLPVAKRIRRLSAADGVGRDLAIVGLEAIAKGGSPQYVGDIVTVYIGADAGPGGGRKAAA